MTVATRARPGRCLRSHCVRRPRTVASTRPARSPRRPSGRRASTRPADGRRRAARRSRGPRRPFVRPTGHLLDEAVATLGRNRGSLYATNATDATDAVKHFKYDEFERWVADLAVADELRPPH